MLKRGKLFFCEMNFDVAIILRQRYIDKSWLKEVDRFTDSGMILQEKTCTPQWKYIRLSFYKNVIYYSIELCGPVSNTSVSYSKVPGSHLGPGERLF
jgi:hypothetical protein